MPKKAQPTGDWRDKILADLPEERIPLKGSTYPTALEIIKVAAYNRRMTIEDFVGRAALAVAIHDSDGENTWQEITDKEYPMADLRRHGLPKRRLRGRGFGSWIIERMR